MSELARLLIRTAAYTRSSLRLVRAAFTWLSLRTIKAASWSQRVGIRSRPCANDRNHFALYQRGRG